MKMKMYILIAACLGFFTLMGCSNKKDGNPAYAQSSSGINCDSGFSTVSADKIDSIMKPSTDTQLRTVTLKSSSKYGYEQSAYNLSGNCFSRKGNNCKIDDQIMFNHGGDAKNLKLYGSFIVLDTSSAASFNDIRLENLGALNLKTTSGIAVSRETIFGNPNFDQKLIVGESSIYDQYSDGTVVLALIDDLWSGDKYQLFKIKIDKVTAGEDIHFSYQAIADAPQDDLKNFFCSKQAKIKKEAAKSEGEATVYGRSYAGYDSATFGFDFGVNGFERKYVHTEGVMDFSSAEKCRYHPAEMCISLRVGLSSDAWGGVADRGDTKLSEVNRSMWSNLQGIDPQSGPSQFRANRTYLISQLTDSHYTFGAIRITEIDPQGRWVKLNWKRVSIESPFQFIKYTQVSIPSAELTGTVILGNQWWKDTHLDIATAERIDVTGIHTEFVYFRADNNSLSMDNRYFPANSGISEVTVSYASLDAVAEDAADKLVNQFSRDLPIKVGAIYVISSQKFWYKASLAVQVVELVPGKSVTLKYKRLFNAQTFVGKWNN